MNKQLSELIEWMEGKRKNLDDPMYSGYILNMAYKRIIEKAKSLQSEEPIMYTQEEMDIQIEFANKEFERGWKERSEFAKIGLKIKE